MRCNIVFDDDYNIVSIKCAINGEYILPDNFDFSHINCYHIVRDGENYEFILDEDKVEETNQQNANSNEIEDLQKKLNNSDYIIAQAFEEVLALNNPLTFVTDIIRIMVRYSTQYAEMLANRREWRNRIEELRR